MTELEWFAARIVLQSVHCDRDDESQGLIEDRVVLVRAGSEDEARSKAEALGRDAMGEYVNAEGNRVRIEFREILDLKPLWTDTIGEGSEVYYQFLREDELEQVRQMIQSRL